MRGLRLWVMRLIAPPLPAASRPSKITTTLRPSSRTHSCSLISSNCRRTNSSMYLYLARGFFGGLPSPTTRQRCSISTPSLTLRSNSPPSFASSSLRRDLRAMACSFPPACCEDSRHRAGSTTATPLYLFPRCSLRHRRLTRLSLSNPAHAQILDLEEVLDAVFRALAADAGFLDAAERRHLGRD